MKYTEEYKDIFSGTFTWRVEHFSKLQSKHYSDVFIIGGFKWYVFECELSPIKIRAFGFFFFCSALVGQLGLHKLGVIGSGGSSCIQRGAAETAIWLYI